MREICNGCKKARKDGSCMVYGVPPSVYVRGGECPINQIERKAKKKRVRVGQQKQKRL